ncbi:MAG: FAD:protein FMN transferase [Verrucomicrobiales bacterium]|nr:FAD:protein FMN transferase [bacterium]MDF1784382.1 FAD:protein FMN transferase [Verrucomicrobiales bacterium]
MRLPTALARAANREPLPRRKVLTLGTGVLLLGAVGWQAFDRSTKRELVRKQARALGSDITLTALHENANIARKAIEHAFMKLEEIEQILSLYRSESQIFRLNRDGKLDQAHPHLLRVLAYAHKVSSASGGAFDISVQPLWKAFHEADKRGVLPSTLDVDMARSKVGWKRVRMTGERVQLDGEGTAITLNGIAQGYAADCVKRVLADAGIEHALIDCGEINALGNSSSDAPWNVGIHHPRELDAFVSVAQLSERCLATSGDYATRFAGDCRWNHLFDPKTGHSPNELASVSVVAPTAMEADALSTAVFVAGVERGMHLMRAFPNTDAFLVLKNGRTLVTKGFPCKV